MNIFRAPVIAISALAAQLLCPISSIAQFEKYGGIYAAYPEPERISNPAPPKGYSPFYISHFARHGSRWLPNDSRYENMVALFADTANLTPLGLDVRRRLEVVMDDARGRGGDLTALGARQHKEMARRMIESYPGIFDREAHVSARSSVVVRCAMSMNAFLVQMAKMRPEVDVVAECNKRHMRTIAFTSDEMKTLEDTLPSRWTMNPCRLMASLFRDTTAIGCKTADLASELHAIASDMQDVQIGVSLYDLFTEGEMRQIYDCRNHQMQTCNGINDQNHYIPQRCAESLWLDIRDRADSMIAMRSHGADLRFGHDTSLYRLLSLMGLFADENRMDVIIPMGANLQIVFYRHKKGKGDTLIRVMHNERTITLPYLTEVAEGGFYKWEDLKFFVDSNLALAKSMM